MNINNKELLDWFNNLEIYEQKRLYYIDLGINEAIKQEDSNAIGRVMANAGEHIVRDYLQKQIETIITTRAEEDGGLINNGEGYDLSYKNIKINVKYRGGKVNVDKPNLHLEQTRRYSEKNINNNKTHNGHVRYSLEEVDIFIFIIPNKNVDIDKFQFIAIPSRELLDI